MLNLLKITFFVLFATQTLFALDFNYSGLPDRYFPELDYSNIDTPDKSPIFTGNFAEVFSKYGKKHLTLNGKNVFGSNRPLNEEQFLKLREQMNSESLSYKEYVHQWIIENLAPHYFRSVLDIEAQNEDIKKEVINKIFFQLISQISLEVGSNSLDTIKLIRGFVSEKLMIKLKQDNLKVALREFKEKDFGKISQPLVIDFSPVLRQAKNPDITDEIFYQIWMNYSSQSIKKFIRFSRRMLVIENELQKQIQMDPMFLISSYQGDEEAIYSKMISGERNHLKRANYRVELIKVKVKGHDLDWFQDLTKKYSQINDLGLIVRELKTKKVIVDRLVIEKFSENNIQTSEGVSSNQLKELWNPIRLMKNQIAIIRGNNENEYFLAGEVSSIGVYTFPLNSSFAKEEIRKELQIRKRKILYKRIVQRLGQKHPLIINFGSCYSNVVFCFPANINILTLGELVKVRKSGEQREYLGNIDSRLFEQSIY